MKIELTDGTIIEITDKNIAKVDGKKKEENLLSNPPKFTFYTPDRRKFDITIDGVIEHVDEDRFPIWTPKEPSDLTELLKGYEGGEFWSPIWGRCIFQEIHYRNGGRPMLLFKTGSGGPRNVTPSGRLNYEYEGCGGECIIWPSKEHQTWDKFGEDVWVMKREDTRELDLYIGHPKYGNLYTTTVGKTNLLRFLSPGKPLLIVK